jgi:hypothetical protein
MMIDQLLDVIGSRVLPTAKKLRSLVHAFHDSRTANLAVSESVLAEFGYEWVNSVRRG